MGRLGHTLVQCSRAHSCSAEHRKLCSAYPPHCRTVGVYPNYVQLGPTRVMDCRTAESTTGCLILPQLTFLIDRPISRAYRDMDCLFHIRHKQGFLNPPGHGQLHPNWSPAGIPKSLGILHLPLISINTPPWVQISRLSGLYVVSTTSTISLDSHMFSHIFLRSYMLQHVHIYFGSLRTDLGIGGPSAARPGGPNGVLSHRI